jgi:SP family arabinose:H+ symporter-like MFS transporter
VAVTTTVLWCTIFTGALLFPLLQGWSERILGSVAGVFWFYGLVCVLAFVFGLTVLPETKGRTLEEIAASWRREGP